MRLRLCLCLLGLVAVVSAEPLRIGSKNFTENVILGEILTQSLQIRSLVAEHRAQLGGTRVLWQALCAGEIDMYSDYSGTLEQEILHRPGRDLPVALHALGLGMSRPWGFNNTYALGVRTEQAEQLGLECISDLLAHPQLRLGFGNEFLSRQDGWPALQAAYGLKAQIAGFDHDLAYRALAAGRIDVTDVYATDAEVEVHKLKLLRDDRGHFPRYDAVIVYRLEAVRDPRVPAVLDGLAGSLDDGAMRKLNRQVRVDGISEAEAAGRWLGHTRTPVGESRAQRMARATREHLSMVAASIFLSLCLGLPLGVASYTWPRAGRILLGLVGMVQTIPSLALLVFLIPLCGLGPITAVVALTLYGLLPIVSGTYTGLHGISPALRESALALGLRPAYRWRHIDLPLALPAIVAGIQTAAVIAVGTATLAALIGGGGYGEPILTGVRLARTDLLLEGAVPAALLALSIQTALGAFYRRLPST